VLIGTGTLLVAGPAFTRLFAAPPSASMPGAGQEQAPNRREFTVTAQDFRFSPNRVEVTQDDLVKNSPPANQVIIEILINIHQGSAP
jgi:hypothetical protein